MDGGRRTKKDHGLWAVGQADPMLTLSRPGNRVSAYG